MANNKKMTDCQSTKTQEHNKSKLTQNIEEELKSQHTTDLGPKLQSNPNVSGDGTSNISICGSYPPLGESKRKSLRNTTPVQLHAWASEMERRNLPLAEILEKNKQDQKVQRIV